MSTASLSAVLKICLWHFAALIDSVQALTRSLRQLLAASADEIEFYGCDFGDAGGSADVDVTVCNRDAYVRQRVQHVMIDCRRVSGQRRTPL